MPSNSECTSLHHASPTHASAEVYITYRPNALTTDRCYSRPNDNNSNTNTHNIIKITRCMTYIQSGMNVASWHTTHTFKKCLKTCFLTYTYPIAGVHKTTDSNRHRWLMPQKCIDLLGTCEASWFDSISNHTFDSRFDSYWWSDSKLSNRPRCQSSFVKKRLVVVKFAFKVDFGSKISVQQHWLTRFMTQLK